MQYGLDHESGKNIAMTKAPLIARRIATWRRSSDISRLTVELGGAHAAD